MTYSDSLRGYGQSRFIEVFFRGFKNNTYGYSSAKAPATITVFGATTGRLSIMHPSQQKTTVAVSKSVVTIFLDIADAEVVEYESDDLSTAYWDRESQELITIDQLKELISADDEVNDSLVHYAS